MGRNREDQRGPRTENGRKYPPGCPWDRARTAGGIQRAGLGILNILFAIDDIIAKGWEPADMVVTAVHAQPAVGVEAFHRRPALYGGRGIIRSFASQHRFVFFENVSQGEIL
jgi:hypothetical protein